MIRWCIVALILGWGYHKGGWWGLYTMLLISGIVLPLFRQGMSEAREQGQFRDPSGDVQARPGKRIDPTRPTQDDYAAMITNDFRQRGKS